MGTWNSQTDDVQDSPSYGVNGNAVKREASANSPTHNIDTELNTSSSLVQSPVLNALRSHIEKWYPETAKHNRLEVEDLIDG